jgi:type VI secretion system protein ImpA
MSMTALLDPIPGDNPSGAYLRYEPIYDQIKEARREDDDLPQGDWQTDRKTADPALVIRLATDALTKKTKDLQLAAWLTEALLRRDGFGGLEQGLRLCHQLVVQYWDTLYPELEDGDAEMRAAPLEWIGLKLDTAVRLAGLNADHHSLLDYRVSRRVPTKEEAESDSVKQEVRTAAIADGKVTPEDFEASFLATSKEWYRTLVAHLDGAAAALIELDSACAERFGHVAPSFMALRDALKEVRQLAGQLFARKLELEPDAADDTNGISLSAAISEAGVESGAPAAAGGPARGGMPAAPRSREESALWIAAAAAQVRRERPTDPTAYLILRGLRWGELRADGGTIDPRLLAAPQTDVRTRLRGLLLDNRWPELLDAGEEVMAGPQGRGWLDLQRYALTACDALGAEYDAVRQAIRGTLRSLLADLPDLPSMTLMDDSPTANAETQAWLREEGLLDGEPEADAPVPGDRPRRTSRRDPFDVARERAAAGDARGAMELLMREAMQEKSARARFLRRAQAAELMVSAGLDAVALPMLRELVEQIETHRLEEWEAGETVAHPLGLLHRCATRLGSDEVDRHDLYVRICRLDPVQAIRLGETPVVDEGD